MEQVRCTQCGSPAVINDNSSGFCKCESCGSMFSVKRAQQFIKVEVDHAKDIKVWREYMYKQLAIQEASIRQRDYDGVKIFATKILSVLPDDFCAQYYSALSDYMDSNETPYLHFLKSRDYGEATDDEIDEVCSKAVAYAEPKYKDEVISFLNAFGEGVSKKFLPILEKNLKSYVDRRKQTAVCARDVFICHRTTQPDQDIADLICSKLESAGMRCWIAPRNILAGSQDYERDITRGVNSCRLFLFISSYKSMYSPDCEKELRQAVVDGKVLFVYKIDGTPLDGDFEKYLSKVQWLDGSNNPEGNVNQLVLDIQGALALSDDEIKKLTSKREAVRERERQEAVKKRQEDETRLQRLEELVGIVQPDAKKEQRIKRIQIELEDENFKKAVTLVDKLLDDYPDDSQAWWLFMLADLKERNSDTLFASGKPYTEHRGYKNSIKFGSKDTKKKIEDYEHKYTSTFIKRIKDSLSHAQYDWDDDNYDSMRFHLEQCEDELTNPDSPGLKGHRDLVSKYYWLKLWLKYGEHISDCEQDIRRETEYKKAYEFGTERQRRHYDDVCKTIGENAVKFLKRYSNNPKNDQMITEYLSDNRGIIPKIEYGRYLSKMYFRKMLANLATTEQELRKSTRDIQSDQYFILARETATPEQIEQYNDLLLRIDENKREQKEQQKQVNKKPSQIQKEKAQRLDKAFLIFSIVITVYESLLLISSWDVSEALMILEFTSMPFLIGMLGLATCIGIRTVAERKGKAFYVYVIFAFSIFRLAYVSSTGNGLLGGCIFAVITTSIAFSLYLSFLKKANKSKKK